MSFAAPIFLLAALAAAIPVVLHMINRQRAKNLPFSTLRFLQLSVEKTRRRKRIHDVLLMVLRAAVLFLIAAGLAKPTVSSLSSLWGGANSAAAIILDNSASMGMIDQDRPRFDTACRRSGQNCPPQACNQDGAQRQARSRRKIKARSATGKGFAEQAQKQGSGEDPPRCCRGSARAQTRQAG